MRGLLLASSLSFLLLFVDSLQESVYLPFDLKKSTRGDLDLLVFSPPSTAHRS